MNVGLEADGGSMPVPLQKGIYQTISQGQAPELLPDHGGGSAAGAKGEAGGAASPTRSGPKASTALQGWASIPRGGLERHEPSLYMGGHSSGPRLAHCILSETSSTPYQPYTPGGSAGPRQTLDEAGEPVWLSLRSSMVLFLSSGPNEAAPYAFIRLQDAVLRDVNHQNRHLILAGRPKSSAKASSPGAMEDASRMLSRLPFGDSSRLPLPLCFLLADGRFQPFEALWLELQFTSDEELEQWAGELGVACDLQRPVEGCTVASTFGPMHAPRPAPSAPDSCPGDVTEESPRPCAPAACAGTKPHEGPRPAG
mmetsp:Transcript_112514/g.342460  ORF Transcript_112514/g.342460 Transcript_112514/m.342460 type:complete len:311 (-) Transcript_112514:136-1068(-)